MVGPGNNINVLTRDNLNVSLDVTIRYQVMAANVITLYKHYPALSWEDNALVPLIRSSVRDVVANYTADELQAVRAQIQAGVENKLTTSLATEPFIGKRHTAGRTQPQGHRSTKQLPGSNPGQAQRAATTASSTVPGSTT